MFTGEQTFVRFFRTGQRISQQAGGFGLWLLIVPGLILILFGVAILLWPELLAYMVAGLFIAIGISITRLGLASLPATALHRSPLAICR